MAAGIVEEGDIDFPFISLVFHELLIPDLYFAQLPESTNCASVSPENKPSVSCSG